MSIIEVRPRTPWAMLMDKMKLLACGMLTVIAAPLAAMLMLGGQLVVVALIVARAALVRIAHRPGRPQPGKGHGCPGHGCPYSSSAMEISVCQRAAEAAKCVVRKLAGSTQLPRIL